MTPNCILSKYATTADGHAKVGIAGSSTGHHRLAYCAAHKLPMTAIAGKVVRHTCDTPNCINPAHLVLGTALDNVKDRVDRGRSAKGSSHGSAKLTEDQVLLIRARKFGSSRSIAAEFGVSHTQIQQIQRGTKWAYIEVARNS